MEQKMQKKVSADTICDHESKRSSNFANNKS